MLRKEKYRVVVELTTQRSTVRPSPTSFSEGRRKEYDGRIDPSTLSFSPTYHRRRHPVPTGQPEPLLGRPDDCTSIFDTQIPKVNKKDVNDSWITYNVWQSLVPLVPWQMDGRSALCLWFCSIIVYLSVHIAYVHVLGLYGPLPSFFIVFRNDWLHCGLVPKLTLTLTSGPCSPLLARSVSLS